MNFFESFILHLRPKGSVAYSDQGSGEKASTSSYTYDSVGNVTLITNGNGKVTSYGYDLLSNLVDLVSENDVKVEKVTS